MKILTAAFLGGLEACSAQLPTWMAGRTLESSPEKPEEDSRDGDFSLKGQESIVSPTSSIVDFGTSKDSSDDEADACIPLNQEFHATLGGLNYTVTIEDQSSGEFCEIINGTCNLIGDTKDITIVNDNMVKFGTNGTVVFNQVCPAYRSPSTVVAKDESGHVTMTVTGVCCPTMIPSLSPTDSPRPSISHSPSLSTAPSMCVDLPQDLDDINQTVWTMPSQSFWENSPFAGKTCSQLEQIVPEDQAEERRQLCEFLCQGIYSGFCAIEACCFCGGGRYAFESLCKNMEWNQIEKASTEFTCACDFIDALPKKNQLYFCENYGAASLSKDGTNVKEACCACGGGVKALPDFEDNTQSQSKRMLNRDNTDSFETPLLPDGNLVIDFTSRSGSGDSPGIRNLQFLGLGYDLIRGNPRGSLSSELDPGFRYRVVRLVQSQNNETIDGQFQVPLGTEVKYATNCRYDDSSVEVSSSSDLRSTMTKESDFTSSSTTSKEAKANNLIEKFSKSVTNSYSFSQNEKFQATTDKNSKNSVTSFEASAFCTEIEASFIPGYKQELDPEFKNATDNLPVPYDPENLRDRELWQRFFSNYGITYVRYLVLGGKRIHATSMVQSDYSDLVSQDVDVSSTMTFEMSAAMSASVNVRAGLVKGLANALGPEVGSIVNVALKSTDDKTSIFGASFNENTDSSTSNFASRKEQASDAFKISQKKLTHEEYTIGGLPSENWRTWAGTVKERPMPVRYLLGSIMEFLSYEQSVAFFEAFEDIYGINLSEQPSDEFGKIFHHGKHA
ncbi:hypothetical protein ACHAWF_010770 [Thalassiosira exigua]